MRDLIFLEQAPSKGKEHSPDAVGTVGREGCDVNIEDTEVSRRHAAIRREGDAVVVEDLGSTNGTFVNGERISGAHSLNEGDEVSFGATVWRLQVRPGLTVPARQVVAEPQVTVARPVTPQPAGAPPPPVGEQASGGRGDVPAPSFAPSVIRRVVPPPGGPTPFNAPNPAAAGRGSAARRQGATLFVTLTVLLTTIGVVLYYVTEPFK